MSDRIDEGQLSYGIPTMSKSTTYYFNFTKDLSWMNSRNFEHTTRDGHVKGYFVDFDIVCKEAAPFVVTTAPNTWKMRNAFRKFHAYRDLMFRKAGITKKEMGKYGRTIRPFLSASQVDVSYPDPGLPQVPTVTEEDTLVPLGCTDGNREWTYTTFANEIAYSEGTDATSLDSEADTWPVMICEENVKHQASGTNMNFSKVGMIHSYNLDRMEVVTPDVDEVITSTGNPLSALIMQSSASGEVVDIAQDQELEAPPYDVDDAGDSINRIVAEYGNTNTETLQVIRLRGIFVPAGIMAIDLAAGADDLTETVLFLATVRAIVECKDVA